MEINRIDTHLIPFEFEYHAPTSLEEALELLTKYSGEVSIMAGGTDLLVKMKQRLFEPGHVVNIKRIKELVGIEEKEDGIHIGAATRLRSIEKSKLVEDKLPLLYKAVKSIGSVQIRGMATLGGNLCNASPAADTAAALLAFDTVARAVGPEGERSFPLEDLFVGPSQTSLSPSEILVGVLVPSLPEGSGTAFIKIGRTSLDIATINIAVFLRIKCGTIINCRIVVGSAAPTPLRILRSEEFLRGKKPEQSTLVTAAGIVSEDIRPITDIRASAEYRREASKGLTLEALTKAMERAEEG